MLKTLCALCAILLLGQCSKPPDARDPLMAASVEKPAVSAHPNVVLIVIDALRADRVGGMRGDVPLMPRLTQFAAQSWLFEHAVAQGTWTKPSMVSLFTSMYPSVHNVQWGVSAKILDRQELVGDVLPGSIETMAQYLKAAGFNTAAIQSNVNLKPFFGVDQGFDTYFYEPYPKIRGSQLTERTLERLTTLEEPFFLYAHYMDAHFTYDPPPAYRELMGTAPVLTPDDRELLKDYSSYYMDKVCRDVGVNQQSNKGDLSPEGQRYIRFLYDAASRYLDDEVMRAVECIRQKNPNTVFIITADHGEEMWEHGSVGHAKTVYEELAHVPLIIAMPNETPRRMAAPVEMIDLLPTLAAYLHLKPSPLWQGRNVLGALESADPARTLFTETKCSLPELNIDLQAVRRGDTKLIVDRKRGTRSLYDLAADPGEMKPLDNAALAGELNALLEAFNASNRQHPGFTPPLKSPIIDEKTRGELEAQGYLGR